MDTNESSLAKYLTPNRTVILKASEKRAALLELTDLICNDADSSFDSGAILGTLWHREENLSTQISPGIAIPHARMEDLGETFVAVGKSLSGIQWNSEDDQPVYVVILILGVAQEYLQVLSRIATRLSNEKIRSDLLAAERETIIYDLLTNPYPVSQIKVKSTSYKFSVICFEHALAMANQMDAATIVLHADAIGDISFLENCCLDGLSLVMVARDESRYPSSSKISRILTVPFRCLNRSNQMEVAFLFLVSQGFLSRQERVVSVCGLPDSGILDTITITSMEEEYQEFFSNCDKADLPADIEPHVLSRVLQVANNLAVEGREGKPVGTMFVMGDYEKVMEHSRQMVINPFKGYSQEECNILDPALEETIKEFSRIDGAFVIRGNGVIESAGTYLKVDVQIKELPSGLGARHAAAALISRQTRALSLVLSESTRKISLFRNGSKILEL